jgi:hypothetical protein
MPGLPLRLSRDEELNSRAVDWLLSKWRTLKEKIIKVNILLFMLSFIGIAVGSVDRAHCSFHPTSAHTTRIFHKKHQCHCITD